MLIPTMRRYHIQCLFVALMGWWLQVGCTHQVNPGPGSTDAPLIRLSPDQYPVFKDDLKYSGLPLSIQSSLDYLNKKAGSETVIIGSDSYGIDEMRASLETFKRFLNTAPSAEALGDYIRDNFNVYQSRGRTDDREVLFTGYFEPILQGSLARSERFSIPLFTRPENIMEIDISLFSEKYKGHKRLVGRLEPSNRIVPYWSRAEIAERGDFDSQARPLVWIEDRVDRFFLEIQGSGRVILNQGSAMNVHYHGTNGHPYRSIGRLLIKENKISREAMSMQAIRAYLRDHPEEINRILAYNPSFVFFKPEIGGPYGSLNVTLTPGRSLATDRKLFPKAALCFIETQKPIADTAGNIHKWHPFSRFVMNQDTGGAIKGAGRADIFWGNGPYAELAAGYLKHPGRLYVLVGKPLSTSNAALPQPMKSDKLDSQAQSQ